VAEAQAAVNLSWPMPGVQAAVRSQPRDAREGLCHEAALAVVVAS
jgi:hypothetical protein